jgi:hypothetical protein
MEGFFIWDVETFDEITVREAVLKAVVHRDYRLGLFLCPAVRPAHGDHQPWWVSARGHPGEPFVEAIPAQSAYPRSAALWAGGAIRSGDEPHLRVAISNSYYASGKMRASRGADEPDMSCAFHTGSELDSDL